MAVVKINGSSFKEYYVQRTVISDKFKNSNRLDLLIPLVQGKRVLHVGFVDWPITNINNNLHLTLAPHCLRLDGIDINADKAEELRVSNGNNFSNWTSVPNDYDIILVPEVIEHVGNVEDFLKLVTSRKGVLVITAPDATLIQGHFEYINGELLEAVHPDHNCHYSPYTLKNTIEKYSDRKVTEMYWVQNQSVVAICK